MNIQKIFDFYLRIRENSVSLQRLNFKSTDCWFAQGCAYSFMLKDLWTYWPAAMLASIF